MRKFGAHFALSIIVGMYDSLGCRYIITALISSTCTFSLVSAAGSTSTTPVLRYFIIQYLNEIESICDSSFSHSLSPIAVLDADVQVDIPSNCVNISWSFVPSAREA